MTQRIDLTGKKFGKLTVESYSHTIKYFAYWNCVCECGGKRIAKGYSLGTGTISCGCMRGQSRTSHRMTKTQTYTVWIHMRTRCYNPKYPEFYRYGGRGITVCERWDDFKNFYDDMGEKPINKSLDRIDNDKGYYPDNCRWATRIEQQNNTSTNRYIEYNGETKTLMEWSRILNLPYYTLHSRLSKLKWDIKTTFETKIMTKSEASRCKRKK